MRPRKPLHVPRRARSKRQIPTHPKHTNPIQPPFLTQRFTGQILTGLPANLLTFTVLVELREDHGEALETGISTGTAETVYHAVTLAGKYEER